MSSGAEKLRFLTPLLPLPNHITLGWLLKISVPGVSFSLKWGSPFLVELMLTLGSIYEAAHKLSGPGCKEWRLHPGAKSGSGLVAQGFLDVGWWLRAFLM